MFKLAQSKSKTTKTIISCLIGGLILILLYIFPARMITRYSNNLKADLISRTQKIKECENLIRAYPNPEKEIETIEKKIQELEAKVTGGEQIPRIIQQLVRKSTELEIDIISIKPVENIKASQRQVIEGVRKVYIEIMMLAPYKVAGEYLKALTELPIILTVEGLTVEKKQETTRASVSAKNNKLLVTLLLSAYMVLEI